MSLMFSRDASKWSGEFEVVRVEKKEVWESVNCFFFFAIVTRYLYSKNFWKLLACMYMLLLPF